MPFDFKKEYKEVRLLGKGKSGYSYLVSDENGFYYVLKKIHHEPCDYYNFSDKLQAEIDDYNILKNFLALPKLIDVDYENEIIIKEYIEGKTIQELIDDSNDITLYLQQIKEIEKICIEHKINIDYYPTNFIVNDNKLVYVDYECNSYDPKWNFENWGKQYWIKK